MRLKDFATIRTWTLEPPPSDVAEAIRRLARCEDVVHVAVLPDVHLAEDVCVGSAIATTQTLYPQAIGGDIGCGMAAVQLVGGTSNGAISRQQAEKILVAFRHALPIVRQRGRIDLPHVLDNTPLSHPHLERTRLRAGREQFGTLGRGNHFLEVQRDENENFWLMAHSGSRGMGHAIRDHHLQFAQKKRGGLLGIEACSELGQHYLEDVDWALCYAAENRRRLLESAGMVMTDVLGVSIEPATYIGCHHNHVQHSMLNHQQVWVHRKGAISARCDEPGIIPGSMGSSSFHVMGRGVEEALYSSSHGAGRRLDRTSARRKITIHQLSASMNGIWFDAGLAHRLREEAPSAYKDINQVMRAQSELTRIVRKLKPALVYKGA